MVVADDDTVAHDTNLTVSGDLAVEDVGTSNDTNVGDLVDLAYLNSAEVDLSELRSKHALHCGGDILDSVINYAVKADLDAVALCVVLSGRVRSYVEANDDSSGSRSEHNVALAYSADRAVNNAYAYFLVGELLKGLLDSLDGTLYVCLDDDREAP